MSSTKFKQNEKTYKLNKKMYNKLQMLEIESINDFYITHSTTGYETLYNILKDGYLRPGSDIDHKHILAPEDLEHIYGNINFSDLNNIDIIGNISLQFSPQLLFDYGLIFNRGWFKYPYETSIYIHESDKLCEKISKLNKIKEYVRNPTFYANHLIKNAGYRAHEIMINKQIPLEKYLISINCVCSDINQNKYCEKIKNIIDTKYPNVNKINIKLNKYGMTPSPTLDDIVNMGK